jgi:hypothetical protein
MREYLDGLEDAVEHLKNFGLYFKAVLTLFFSAISSAFRGGGTS